MQKHLDIINNQKQKQKKEKKGNNHTWVNTKIADCLGMQGLPVVNYEYTFLSSGSRSISDDVISRGWDHPIFVRLFSVPVLFCCCNN